MSKAMTTTTVGYTHALVLRDPAAVLGMSIELFASSTDAMRANWFHNGQGEIKAIPIKSVEVETR